MKYDSTNKEEELIFHPNPIPVWVNMEMWVNMGMWEKNKNSVNSLHTVLPV